MNLFIQQKECARHCSKYFHIYLIYIKNKSTLNKINILYETGLTILKHNKNIKRMENGHISKTSTQRQEYTECIIKIKLKLSQSITKLTLTINN